LKGLFTKINKVVRIIALKSGFKVENWSILFDVLNRKDKKVFQFTSFTFLAQNV